MAVSGQFSNRSKVVHIAVGLRWECGDVDLFVRTKHNLNHRVTWWIQSPLEGIYALMHVRITRKWVGGQTCCYQALLRRTVRKSKQRHSMHIFASPENTRFQKSMQLSLLFRARTKRLQRRRFRVDLITAFKVLWFIETRCGLFFTIIHHNHSMQHFLCKRTHEHLQRGVCCLALRHTNILVLLTYSLLCILGIMNGFANAFALYY